MATATTLPMAEYLETSYEPDREYVDGELRERNVGKFPHSFVQAWLTAWFFSNRKEWNTVTLTEQRVQVSPTRVRIPDVCLVKPGPTPAVLTAPPILVVEILSPGDTCDEMKLRCGDYLLMGVQDIWIIDPATQTGTAWLNGINPKTGQRYAKSRWLKNPRLLAIAWSSILVDLDELFADLEESRQS